MPFESEHQPIAPRAPRPNLDAGDHAALQDVMLNVRGGPGLDEHITELWSKGIEVDDDNDDYIGEEDEVHTDAVGRKGANNVVSLIMKTLRDLNLLRTDEQGDELNIVFDNCTGQNKKTRC